MTAGSSLYGIVGAFLAVPVAACMAVVIRYIGEQIDRRLDEQDAADAGPPDVGDAATDNDTGSNSTGRTGTGTGSLPGLPDPA